MAILAGVGSSTETDSYNCAVVACSEAIKKLGGFEPSIIFVFASVQYEQRRVIEGIRSVNNKALLTGCSTAGEISQDGLMLGHSVVVMAVSSDQIEFNVGAGVESLNKELDAGIGLVKSVKKQMNEKIGAFILFTDILKINGSAILAGVARELGANVPIFGGASGDDFDFKKTYQYLNGNIYSDSSIGVGLSGTFNIGLSVGNGWAPVGRPMTVTSSQGSVINTIDNKPAIDVYKEYFGRERAQELQNNTLANLAITYPLGVTVVESKELLLRYPISVDSDGAIKCAAGVPTGSEIRLMVGSRARALQIAKLAVNDALKQLNGSRPNIAMVFSSVARQKLLEDSIGEEIDAIQAVIGFEVPLIGFYTYGEIAPIANHVSQNNQAPNYVSKVHNESILVVLIAE